MGTSASSSEPRHAVVTGTSGGIGRAIAARLLADGWQVTGLDVAPATLSQAAFTHRDVDLTDDAATADVARALFADGPRAIPSALVHAAGLMRTASVGGLDPEAGALMWKLHVDAATRLADVALPRMADAGRGRLVLVGSRVARGAPGRSQYAATKAALPALARSWAAEVVARGVTVNVVAPAATATGMLEDPGRSATPPRVPPMGRLIEPAEIAALVAFLLGPEAAAITGQEIVVCGGSSL